MAGAQPEARKPCVRGRQASEPCQEGGPGPALLRVLANNQENDLSKCLRGRKGPLSPWWRKPPILSRGAHVPTGGWAGVGGRSPCVPGASGSASFKMRPESEAPARRAARTAGSQTTKHMSDITGLALPARRAGVWAPRSGSALVPASMTFTCAVFSCACLDSAWAGGTQLPGRRWGAAKDPLEEGVVLSARREEKNGGPGNSGVCTRGAPTSIPSQPSDFLLCAGLCGCCLPTHLSGGRGSQAA